MTLQVCSLCNRVDSPLAHLKGGRMTASGARLASMQMSKFFSMSVQFYIF